ncbi:MAG: hypothetical protein HY238_00330, partial [Acidobacteria bacterium]|nr:hypothetical protein [Acidobacteriota bacterium]
MNRWSAVAAGFSILLNPAFCAQLKVRISWGHEAGQALPYYVRLIPATGGVEVRQVVGYSLEPGEGLKDGAWQSSAGAGDIDGVEFTVGYPDDPPKKLQNLHIIWADLISASDADTARRLSRDPAFRVNAPKLTVQMDPEGTKGFTVAIDQLLEEKALWIPSLHVFLATGEPAVSFADHQKTLEPWKGRRILDQVQREPEATYEQYKLRWEDLGNPGYVNPQQRGPGHIVGLAWDSAVAKFGIDRGAGVWNDYGNPDRFQFWFGFGDLTQGIARTWKGQSLKDGLPVITTVFEDNGVGYEVEQFAFPLQGPPAERRGDMPMVLLQKVRLTELHGTARQVPVTMNHRRQLPAYADSTILAEKHKDAMVFRESGYRRVLFSLQGADGEVRWAGATDYQRELKRVNATVLVDLAANGSRELVVKLPSPMVEK